MNEERGVRRDGRREDVSRLEGWNARQGVSKRSKRTDRRGRREDRRDEKEGRDPWVLKLGAVRRWTCISSDDDVCLSFSGLV